MLDAFPLRFFVGAPEEKLWGTWAGASGQLMLFNEFGTPNQGKEEGGFCLHNKVEGVGFGHEPQTLQGRGGAAAV